MTEHRTGGCLCGAVRYRVAGPMRPVIACHCTQCRKTSGHHVAATSAPREAVTIDGEDALTWYESTPGTRRGFCARCGSNLFWDSAGAATLSIFAGTLNGVTGLKLKGHIYVGDKGDYYEIGDALPRAAASDPDLTTQG